MQQGIEQNGDVFALFCFIENGGTGEDFTARVALAFFAFELGFMVANAGIEGGALLVKLGEGLAGHGGCKSGESDNLTLSRKGNV
jgi:hypothetical protein